MRNHLKKCDICQEKIKDGHLGRHRKSCLRKWERRDRGTCLYCSYKFSRGRDLRRHLKRNACGAREYIDAQKAAAPGVKVKKPTPSKHSKKERQFKNCSDIASEQSKSTV